MAKSKCLSITIFSIFLLFLILPSCKKGPGDKVIPRSMTLIKGGCFEMGNSFGYVDEGPAHTVCVNDFYLSKYDITVLEFKYFIKDLKIKTDAETSGGCSYPTKGGYSKKDPAMTWQKPGFDQNDSDPVVCVGWNDVDHYIQWRNEKEKQALRLPTEAEWEYAARGGGKNEKWAGTNNETELGDFAWYESNSKGKTHPGGYKRANSFGLYDMTGHVWQWVNDWYSSDYYKLSPKDNPQGPQTGMFRVRRGGDWDNIPKNIKASVRWGYSNGSPDNRVGFRLALSIPK